jgi:hypothetical protein
LPLLLAQLLPGSPLLSASRNGGATASHPHREIGLTGSLRLPPPLSTVQGDGVKSIIIPGIVGVVCGLLVGMLLFYTCAASSC